MKWPRLFLAVLLAGGLPLRSDTVVMKDGSTQEGQVVSQSQTKVVLELMPGMKTEISREDIQEIRRSSPAASPKAAAASSARAASTDSAKSNPSGTVVPPPPDISSASPVAPLQDIDRWGKFFLERMKELGFPEKPEWFRKEFESSCKEVGRMFTLEQRKESVDRETRKKTWPLIKKADVDFKNEEEKKAKVKVLEGGAWSFRAEVPATNAGITECWVKGKAGSPPKVSGYYTYSQLHATIDMWFQYHWDAERNQWVETTLAQEKACRQEAEAEYRKKIESELARVKTLEAKDLSSDQLAREAYERVKTYLPKYEEALKKAEAQKSDSMKEWSMRQAEGVWKSAVRFLFQTYQSTIKRQALEAYLAELDRNPSGK